MKRVAGWVVGALVGWLILSALGEDTAAVILSAAPDAAGDAVAVGLMVGAPVLSIGVALAFGVRIMRNRTVTSCARYVGAAFAAFYCAGLGIGGVLDWNPYLIVAITAVCMVAGVAVLRVRSRTTER